MSSSLVFSVCVFLSFLVIAIVWVGIKDYTKSYTSGSFFSLTVFLMGFIILRIFPWFACVFSFLFLCLYSRAVGLGGVVAGIY